MLGELVAYSFAAERGYKLFTTTAGIILSHVSSLRKSTLM
jgi:hypothetical protein